MTNYPEKLSSDEVNDTANFKKISSNYYSIGPVRFKTPLFNSIEDSILEIFGMELYLDDIIILCLIFFLYKEGVQDEMLFIILILLLFS